jgi:hypothetical protein
MVRVHITIALICSGSRLVTPRAAAGLFAIVSEMEAAVESGGGDQLIKSRMNSLSCCGNVNSPGLEVKVKCEWKRAEV